MYDLKDEDQVKEYLKNVNIEYQFQCYHEKRHDGCHRLASFLETIKKDWEEAHKVFKTNCIENKYGPSCFKLGNYNLLGRACQKNEEDALKYYELGCEQKHAESCHNAALMHQDGKTKDKMKDFAKVEDYLTKACHYDDMMACYRLSSSYINGKFFPKNMELAFKYALRACERDNPYACANVSRMYLLGEGVEKSQEKSKHFKDRAMNLYNSTKEKGILSGDNVSQK